MLGGDFAGHGGVDSTSGFYHGGYNGLAGFYGGLFADVPISWTGPRNVPLQSWVLSVDPVVDFMHSGGMNYSGLGGGFPVTGSMRVPLLHAARAIDQMRKEAPA